MILASITITLFPAVHSHFKIWVTNWRLQSYLKKKLKKIKNKINNIPIRSKTKNKIYENFHANLEKVQY